MNVTKDYYLPAEAEWLQRLKQYAKLKLYKNHCTLVVNTRLYYHLLSLADEKFARLISLFVVFSGSKGSDKLEFDQNNTGLLGVPDLGKMLGVSDRVKVLSVSDIASMTGMNARTVRRRIAKYNNSAFLVLTAEHVSSYHQFIEHKSDHIAFNSYHLLERVFDGFDEEHGISRRDSWLKFKIEYKGLDIENYLVKCYHNGNDHNNTLYNTITPNTPTAYYRGQNFAQYNDSQPIRCEIFKHFRNPIYEPGFDAENTPYPVNWYRHPDAKARFIKGRWYHGTIHDTKKGHDRLGYLEPQGLTYEIDMHNAMFYFMYALLPDTVSKEDKAEYLDLVKSGRLYDEVVDLHTVHADGLLDVDVCQDRAYIKERFQQYRNLAGKRKKQVPEIDSYFEQRFPTVRKWMLEQKQMQNHLAWIETDFITRVLEGLSDGNIRYEWLHDAVYVSEKDSVRAQEIWDSVRDEFEGVFK